MPRQSISIRPTPRLPFARFAWHVVLVSLAALLPLLAFYIAMQPGFAAMLAGGGPALSRFLRQVATNGLPVVFAVNYLGFLLYALSGPLGGAVRLYRQRGNRSGPESSRRL